MADMDIGALARELGFEIDLGDPIGSMKRAADALREKAEKADASAPVDERLQRIESALEGLAEKVSGIETPSMMKDVDDEPVRKSAELLAKAKVMPAEHELQHVIMRQPQDSEEKALQDFNDQVFLLSKLKGVHPSRLQLWNDTIKRSPALQKTMTSDGSPGAGVDWVPTGFSGQVWEDIRLQTLVGSNLVNIQMPTMAYTIPYKLGSTTAYLTSQATDNTVSDFTTGNDTLTAKGFGIALRFSGEMDEDSIVPITPIVTADIATTLAEGLENALLNGDDANPNQDGITSSTDVRRAWDGFRVLSLANAATKADLGTFSTSNLRAMRKLMGKYGVRPADLMWVTGPWGNIAFLGLTETITVDKYGANATVLSGEIGKFDGIPIIISGQIRQDLNASGVYDGSVTDNSVLHLINKKCFYLGTRRGVTIEDDRFILGDYTLVVGKARWAFTPANTVSDSYPTAVIGYNLG